jgi:monoamine oxidase
MLRNVLGRTHGVLFRFPVRFSSGSRTMSSRPHVGVIGAGLSGLRCADILIQNGARVTILEARDRIGGRVGDYAVRLED